MLAFYWKEDKWELRIYDVQSEQNERKKEKKNDS